MMTLDTNNFEAIRFYGRAAERFVQAVDVAIEQIRGDPERFREVEPFRNFLFWCLKPFV